MSIKLMSAIFETEFTDLKIGADADRVVKASTAKIVMLAIADHANDEGKGSHPGLTRLERKTGLSRQGVIDAIKALKYNGIIHVLDEMSEYGTNEYVINTECFPCLEGSQATLLVKPLDQSSHLTSTSQATLPVLVKPLDSNHTGTSKLREKPPRKKGDLLDGILAFTRPDLSEEEQACAAFERAFGIERPWNWYPPKDERLWSDFRAKLLEIWREDKNAFEGFAAWTRAPYSRGAVGLARIKQKPDLFWDAWAAYKASEMYAKPKPAEPRPPVPVMKPMPRPETVKKPVLPLKGIP